MSALIRMESRGGNLQFEISFSAVRISYIELGLEHRLVFTVETRPCYCSTNDSLLTDSKRKLGKAHPLTAEISA